MTQVLPYERDRSLVRRVCGIYPDVSGNVWLDGHTLGCITLDDCDQPGYPPLLDINNHIQIKNLPGTFNPFGHTFQGPFKSDSDAVGWYCVQEPVNGSNQRDALGRLITVTAAELSSNFVILLNTAEGEKHWVKYKIPYPFASGGSLVTSVNGKTGDVMLTLADIDTTINTRIEALEAAFDWGRLEDL